MKQLSIWFAIFLSSTSSMAKEIKTIIVIQASPEKVWSILTHFENYPEWNPFIINVNGEVQEGNTISISIQPPKGSRIKFKPKVLSRKKNEHLSWKGKVIIKGLFDGLHQFELIDNKDGTTTFLQSEKFTGIFVWLFNTNKTENGFNAMNRKLKALAEI